MVRGSRYTLPEGAIGVITTGEERVMEGVEEWDGGGKLCKGICVPASRFGNVGRLGN